MLGCSSPSSSTVEEQTVTKTVSEDVCPLDSGTTYDVSLYAEKCGSEVVGTMTGSCNSTVIVSELVFANAKFYAGEGDSAIGTAERDGCVYYAKYSPVLSYESVGVKCDDDGVARYVTDSSVKSVTAHLALDVDSPSLLVVRIGTTATVDCDPKGAIVVFVVGK